MIKKLKQFTKIAILIFGITITITNCSKDELANEELTETQKIKYQFSLEDFDNPFVKTNLRINWNKFKLLSHGDTSRTTYEFNTTLKANNFIENGETTLFFKYTLQASKIKEGQWDFEIVKFITEDNVSLKKASVSSSDDFSGTIAHFNLYGELTAIIGIEEGLKIDPPAIHSALARIPLPTDHNPSDDESGGAGFQWVKIVHYTEWYKVYPDGTREYTHTVENYTSWEFIYVPSNSNYSTSTPYRNYQSEDYFFTNRDSGDNIEDDKVDDSELTGKAKCIYDKLTKSNSNLFKETIGQFIDDPKYDLKFVLGNCINTDVACTDGSNVDATGEIIITIEDTTQPILELAATILHEAIHAEIFRYVSRFENGLDTNKRARLLQLYSYYKGLTNIYPNESYAVSDAQHVYMAENYVKPIAEAIRKLDSNKYPLNYYMWYGWEGLDTFDYRNKLTPELETEYNNKQTIVNRETNVNCD